MTVDKDIPNAVIEYPCLWPYKVIGRDEGKVRQAIIALTGDENLAVNRSNTSSGGKYLSLGFEIMVLSEEERNAIYSALKNHPDIMIAM